jgi:hypothetical protein
MYSSAIGLLLSLGIAALAWRRSRALGGYYDRDVYGMDRTAHVRYAAVSLAFAAFFCVAWALRWSSAGIAALALYALVAVFYVTSFLQGAADADE